MLARIARATVKFADPSATSGHRRRSMPPIRIGDFAIDRIADFEGPAFGPADFFPDFDPEVVHANADLIGPRLLNPATGLLVFSFHSFVVRTGRHTILIDACIGNDK